jgi:hypothetical protein
LRWCGENHHENISVGSKVPVPVNVSKQQLGDPFLLVSKASTVPNLHAVGIHTINEHYYPMIYCLHYKDKLRQAAVILSQQSKPKSAADELLKFEREVDEYLN